MQKTSILHSESIFLSITLFSYNLRKKKLQFLQFFFFGSKLCQNITKNTTFDKVASGRIKPVKHKHIIKIEKTVKQIIKLNSQNPSQS